MDEETVPVPRSFLERAATFYSADTLNMHDQDKSTAKVLTWCGKTWTCTGSVSQHLIYKEVHLREAVPLERYHGPPHDPTKRGPGYYTGGQFRYRGKIWAMTDRKVILIPNGEEDLLQQLHLL